MELAKIIGIFGSAVALIAGALNLLDRFWIKIKVTCARGEVHNNNPHTLSLVINLTNHSQFPVHILSVSIFSTADGATHFYRDIPISIKSGEMHSLFVTPADTTILEDIGKELAIRIETKPAWIFQRKRFLDKDSNIGSVLKGIGVAKRMDEVMGFPLRRLIEERESEQ